jgi:AbiV family abortive infection protein
MAHEANTLIIANAARLLADAKLLVDHARFASAFALAVLGVEEIGKVALEIWEPLSRSRSLSLGGPLISVSKLQLGRC